MLAMLAQSGWNPASYTALQQMSQVIESSCALLLVLPAQRTTSAVPVHKLSEGIQCTRLAATRTTPMQGMLESDRMPPQDTA